MNALYSLRYIRKLAFSIVLSFLLIVSFGPAQLLAASASPTMSTSASNASALDPCPPSITFTTKPPFGSLTETILHGRADCVTPANYKVAVYIYVTGWWTKPTFALPLTSIASDGSWQANVVTGGLDQLAVKYAAFLVPNGYTPPQMSGGRTFPPALFENSVTYQIEDRLRTIQFSGYTWNVKASAGAPIGPGPNDFSADPTDVWVDANGSLHLTITQHNGKWYSTEIYSDKSMNYGTYTFTLASPVDQLDKNVVLGLFTWDDIDPAYSDREIDIEFSRWGDAAGLNSQYVVQPFDRTGNRHRFNTALTGLFSTHSFKWERDKISFLSRQGSAPSLGAEIQSWVYTGSDLKPSGAGNARINLWLYNSVAPSNGQRAEVVIKSFKYEPIKAFSGISMWTTDFGSNQGWHVDRHPRMLADVNGDGKEDAVGFFDDGVWVGLSNGTRFNTKTRWTSNFSSSQGWRVDQHPRMLGDVNGDGRDDVVGFGYEGVWIALSTGNGFGPVSKWTSNFNYNQGWRVNQHPRTVADVNGDGKDDLIGFGTDGVWVALSTGSGFGSISKWNSNFGYNQGWRVDQHPRMAADVNGDGKADLIGFGNTGVSTALSSGTRFNSITRWTADFNSSGQGWRADQHPRMTADINGDGKADLLGFGYYGVWMGFSNGAGLEPIEMITDDFNYSIQGWRIEQHPRLAGDVNGDGRDDLIGFGNNGVWVVTAR